MRELTDRFYYEYAIVYRGEYTPEQFYFNGNIVYKYTSTEMGVVLISVR